MMYPEKINGLEEWLNRQAIVLVRYEIMIMYCVRTDFFENTFPMSSLPSPYVAFLAS